MDSKAKNQKFSTEYPFNFDLIGIVSSAKEYKLAWHLNQLEEFHLIKDKDIQIDFQGENQFVKVSSLTYLSEFRNVYLLKNKVLSSTLPSIQHLLPEAQQFDYLMKLSSETDENWANTLLLRLKNIPVIDYCIKIDVNRLKVKENLLF